MISESMLSLSRSRKNFPFLIHVARIEYCDKRRLQNKVWLKFAKICNKLRKFAKICKILQKFA